VVASVGWLLAGTTPAPAAADTTAPTVTVNQTAGQPDPTSTSPVSFTVVFSEPVTGFTGTDISFTASTAAGTLTATVTGAGPTYNVAVSGMTGTGAVVVSIPAAAATDLAGNPSTASTSTDNTVRFVRARQSLPGVVTGSTSWSLRNSLTSGGPTAGPFTNGARPALVPVTGDWDGDGVKTPGYYQAGAFHLRNTNEAGPDATSFTFGNPRGLPGGRRLQR